MSSRSPEIQGLKQFVAKLRDIANVQSKKIARRVLFAGLNTGKRAIVAECPGDMLRSSIGSRPIAGGSATIVQGKVGVLVATRKNPSSRWAPIQVTGSPPRFRGSRKGKVSTGQIKPNPVVHRGMASASGNVRSSMDKTFRKEMRKINLGVK